MIIEFNIFKENSSWKSQVHQLNGDILTRHILVKSNVGYTDINLSYCEKTSKGSITDSDNQLIGDFHISG